MLHPRHLDGPAQGQARTDGVGSRLVFRPIGAGAEADAVGAEEGLRVSQYP